MRIALRSVVLPVVVGSIIVACGSAEQSTFGVLTDAGGNEKTPPPGSFTDNDEAGVNPVACTPMTCASQNVNCGKVGDGCGAILECGTCADGQICGAITPSQCGVPPCTAKTCEDIGADCGKQADGCGGVIASCGTCDTGTGAFCGGGGASKCGFGIGSDGGSADGGVCTPKTCTDLGATCGQQADGCGNLIDCGTCNANAGESCGGGGIPSQCGKACTPITSCPAGMNCGAVADGCGGIVSCGGACSTGTCGGGGQPNVCGSQTTCEGLCLQQTTCQGGGTTSISGTVTSPNGVLPIYGALVYVPLTTPPAFTTGVSCDQCGAGAGIPLVSTTTGPDGKFLLPNMPVSSTAQGKVNEIPVVIQLGRWRKQIKVVTSACSTTPIPVVNSAAPTTLVGGAARPSPDAITASLPRNKSEGDIPLTAISTGDVDGLECVFRKLGISDSEFTDPSGNGRIRFYQDNGAVITKNAGTCSISNEACDNYGGNCTSHCSGSGSACSTVGGACGGSCSNTGKSCNNFGGACPGNHGTCVAGGTCMSAGVCNQSAGTPPASSLYNDPDELAKYDMTIFECVGGRQDKTNTQQANVRDYANKGGRVYATHFSYVWLYNAGASPWNNTASWAADSHSWQSAIATLDTSFGKGQAFAQWLNIVGGLNTPLPSANPPWNPPPKITIQEARHDANDPVVAPAQRWLYTTTGDSPNVASVQHYTFNTDYTKPSAQQCGRVLFSDFHVSTDSSTKNVVFPNECDESALTTQEKVLAFMLFDLASCVAPAPPVTSCQPKSCADQGIQCGQAGDGCGNVITCPNCPAGQSCGGGGTPSQCGASSCTPGTCPADTCGKRGDGCGGTLDCGGCASGVCGGGGVANKCGVGTCNPTTCPAPVVGSQCGPVADGCGSLLSCQCPAGTSCINGMCTTFACTPKTCEQLGANCGQLADGCGNIIDCGTCRSPQSCGGGGLANVCGGGVN